MSQRASAAAWCEAGVCPGVRRAGEPWRWERGVYHNGVKVSEFVHNHLSEPHRRVLLIGGAGFDPRTLTVARLLADALGKRLHGLFLREQRRNPEPALLTYAEQQLAHLRELVPGAEVHEINVFEDDDAVGIGRHAVGAAHRLDFTLYTDIVVDFSALSIGSSFPITKLVITRLENLAIAGRRAQVINLHAMVTSSPSTDDCIVPQPSTVVGTVHGFQGRLGIDETARAARLWMPQLRFERRAVLRRIFEYLKPKPEDIVPVLPFPAHDPRLGDRLIECYAEELEDTRQWGRVDARSIVYADEGNPLDFYRTVLRIHDGRHPVFASTGGSLLLLSPVGSKVLALGAMMAAIERDLPVVHEEALSYSYKGSLDEQSHVEYNENDLVHVWLHGEAYPAVRERTGPVARP